MDHNEEINEPELAAEAVDERALPEALYPLRDGTYGSRKACEVEQARLAGTDTPSLLLGKGVLLLNPLTKSYLTPFGFKALFEYDPAMIHRTFEHAGLDPDKSYFHGGAPDILVHDEHGRFVPSSNLANQDETLPLRLRFREEDIYLQNFSQDGTKRTGSYTPYIRATQRLKERHVEALAGKATHIPAAKRAEPALQEPVEKQDSSPKRTFTRTSRDKRRSVRHSQPRA